MASGKWDMSRVTLHEFEIFFPCCIIFFCFWETPFGFPDLSQSVWNTTKTKKKLQLNGCWWLYQKFSGSGELFYGWRFLKSFFQKIQDEFLHVNIQLIFVCFFVVVVVEWSCTHKWNKSVRTLNSGQMVVHIALAKIPEWEGTISPSSFYGQLLDY